MLWNLRDLAIYDNSMAADIYRDVSNIVLDNRDGDLVRVAIVVLGTCLQINQEELAEDAISITRDFFEMYDIDGSQIIMAQTLLPLVSNSNTNNKVQGILEDLKVTSANRSVDYSIDLMRDF